MSDKPQQETSVAENSTPTIPLSKRTPSEWSFGSAIQESVDNMIRQDPIKHKLAQNFGDFLMDTPFATLDTYEIPQEDTRGERLLVNTILNNIKQYGLTISDLGDEEKRLLSKVLGSDWHEILNV